MVIGIAGMVLIGISSFLPKGTEKSHNTSDAVSAQEYRQLIEEQLTEIVIKISGDKKAKVLVTLETGKRFEYAGETEDETKEKKDGEQSEKSDGKKETTITVKSSDGSETAIVVTEYMPQIRGVAVVCNGGNREDISSAVKSAVAAALNITSKRISVTGGQ
ncbi:MAG: hypothetical protein U0L72_01645 [Acutalibacteraceae bacterium]|nr:hypothetical protein [Acutalibacteraceae bacterium]